MIPLEISQIIISKIIWHKNDSQTDDKNKLLTVATKRIGAIGIYCHNFDLKSWNQNATLAGNPDSSNISRLQL